MPCGERLDYPSQESRRQKTVIIAITTTDFPKIIAGPIEFIALCNNDPGTIVIKSEMTFNRNGKLECTGGFGGRSMCDR